MGFLGYTIKTGLRVGIVAAAVKLSIDNCVWSPETDQGYATFEKLKQNVLPGTVVYPEHMPSKAEVQENIASKWNRNVNCAFSYLNAVPSRVYEKVSTFKMVPKSQRDAANQGNIYVRGQFGLPRCRKEFYSNDMAGGSFGVAMGDCGMSKIRQLQPQGMNYNLIIMTSFHPQFVTKVDRAFNIRCFYAQADRPVLTELEVGEVTPMSIQQEETVDGPIARAVQVGDLIVHKWECDNPNFGMLVKNCYVNDGGTEDKPLIDERGCPTQSSVIQGLLTYANTLQMAFVPVLAFSFPDRSLLNFRCQIQVCNKAEGECMGVSPPNCPAIAPNDYYPNSIVNGNVDPTQVVGTYYPPSPAYPVNNPGFGPLLILSNPFKDLMRPGECLQLITSLQMRAKSQQLLLPKHSQRGGPSASDPSNAFKQLSVKQGEGKASARARRAEEETLDVVASPMQVLNSPVGMDGDQDQEGKRNFRSTDFSSFKKPDYCMHKAGFVTLLAFIIVLSIFALGLSAYVFNDIVLKRNKCKKGLITARRDSFTNIGAAEQVRWSQIEPVRRVERAMDSAPILQDHLLLSLIIVLESPTIDKVY
uniref:MICOS complex subunit MIC13 n=1 Tax=Ditylenchus dipsaci TaxID=166011 RepID=A0A915EJ01_9BILA